MNLSFRLVSVQDYAVCEEIFRSNVGFAFDERGLAEFRSYFHRAPRHYYLVETEERVVACGGCNVDHRGIATLDWGMVHHSCQRMGIGTFLLKQRLAVIRQTPYVWSVVLEAIPSAVEFYERHGFSVVRLSESGSDRYFVMRHILR